jgi:GTP-binding protein HflX
VQRRLNREKSKLSELRGLAESAGYTVVAEMEQTRRADARYQIGAGKVGELAALVKETGAEKVIFDNTLRTLQAYNLAKATHVEIIDRFALILEIFTRRATTTEAKLQIQLATLKNELKHAKEKVRLTKMGEQPGFMGIGVYEADVYREAIKRQVYTIQKKLRKIRGKRILQRERRVELGFRSISLAGYTNAGKSSLFNALAEESTKVDNALFTTLSTTTRQIEISKRRYLLTDTVGFIDRLPLSLIEAFHSTLEETIYSDLIIQVLDVSETLEDIEKKYKTSQETVERIGATGVPVLTTLNKIDKLSGEETEERIESLKDKIEKPIPISAMKRINLDLLRKEILRKLEGYIQASFTAPLKGETMALMSWIYSKGDVKKAEYLEGTLQVIFEADPEFAEKVKKRVEDLNGNFESNTQPR